MKLKDFDLRKEIIKSWNNTITKKALVIYPKNISELSKLIKLIKIENKNYLLRTGSCSYDSKSINPDLETLVISLRNINNISKIDLKNSTIEIEAGALIVDVIKKIKNKNITLFSVPGGNKISIGGAISANTIGKDSSRLISSFGDALLSLTVLTAEGKIIKILKKNSLNKYVGAFGMEGLILKAKLKVKKIKSPNLLISSKILKNIRDVKKDLNTKSDYHYIQMDPFFRKKNFAISFKGQTSKLKKNIYKNVNLKSYTFEEILFKFLGFFINSFTWRLFYKLFFLLNSKINKVIDIHNFHYSSKYKHLIPLVCNNGLLDYEILIKNNFVRTVNNLIYFLKENKIYPIYIVVKKIFKSKNKYNYQFNEDGYAFAMSIDKSLLKEKTIKSLQAFLLNNKLKLNLSKTDEKLIKLKSNKNNLFLSLYKKMLLK